MSLAHFQVVSHTIASQHLREYPNATKSGDTVLQLAIKEYKPLNNLDPEPGSVTIIALHANGFPKVGQDEKIISVLDNNGCICVGNIRALVGPSCRSIYI